MSQAVIKASASEKRQRSMAAAYHHQHGGMKAAA